MTTHTNHDDDPSAVEPNHHAHHPGFHGPLGLVAALSMTVGRLGHARLAAELVGLAPGDHLVDIGCGPGAAAREAARRGAEVTGVDPAPVMLRVARLLGSRGAVTWRFGSAEELPLPDGSTSVAWALSSAHHWTDLDRGLAETRRVLGPAGRFLALEHCAEPGATGLAGHGWTGDQAHAFADRCRAAGFPETEVSSRPGRGGSVVTVVARVGDGV